MVYVKNVNIDDSGALYTMPLPWMDMPKTCSECYFYGDMNCTLMHSSLKHVPINTDRDAECLLFEADDEQAGEG